MPKFVCLSDFLTRDSTPLSRYSSRNFPVLILLSQRYLKKSTVTTDLGLKKKLPHVSQVLLQQLVNLHVIKGGWVWDEGKLSMCGFMDSP